MNNYTRYSSTIKTDCWTRVPIIDQWLDSDFIFGLSYALNREIKHWLDDHQGGYYAVVEDDDDYFTKSIMFSDPKDAAFFLLRWS